MNLTLIVGLLTIAGAYFAARTPSEEELVASFQEAQRFYAEGAYDQAIAEYTAVTRVQSKVLTVQNIEVVVGEERFPLRDAALYQIGNAHSKLYQDYTRFAEETPNDEKRAEYQALSDSTFAQAVAGFRHVIETATSEVLRIRAHSRLIDLFFTAKAYPEVIAASQEMIANYPNSSQIANAYYNTGWAYYETKSYGRAIQSFEALLAHFSTGYQSDRSLFQIGECYREQGDCLRAIGYYRRLVERQRIETLTEDELLQMKREKMAGLVDETALELAAKAMIRVGSCYAQLGSFAEGLQAYHRVIDLFSTERSLVEEAYLRMADLYREQGNLDAALQTYREAIDQSQDRTLKARIQYALAERLFSQGLYEQAIQEYRIYLQGYGDIARVAGFSQDRVRYRIGSSHQQLGQQYLEAGNRSAATGQLEHAIAQYDTLYDAAGSYVLDSQFNRALAHQALATASSVAYARTAYETIIQEDQEAGYTQRALVQLAELLFEQGQYADAAERAEQLLHTYADSEFTNEALMRLALSRQAEGDLDQAGVAFLRVAPASPYFVQARIGGGHVFLTQGKYSEAIAALEPAFDQIEDEKQLGSYHYLLGQAYSGQDDYRRAITHFTEALGLSLDSKLVEALHLSRSNAAFAVEDYQQGEQDLHWIIENVEDEEKVRFARNALAFSYIKQNRGGDAVQVLDAMVAQADGPKEKADLLNRMMDLHYDQDNYPQTVRTARQLLALDFADESASESNGIKEKAYFILGDALLRLGQNAEAVDVFNQALNAYPNSRFAQDMQLALGTHYFSQGELDRAVEIFTQLKGTELNSEKALLVSFYLANAHYSLREFAQAQVLFQQLLADYPNARELPDILFGLAESFYQQGQYAEAIVYYQRLLGEFSDEPSADDAQYNMAWCLIELKREEQAMQAFHTLLTRYPQSEFAASVQFTFGDYAYNRGDYQEAMRLYLLVQERFPTAEVASQVPRLVAELREAIAYERYEQGIALMDSAEVTKETQYYQQAVEIFQDVIDNYPGTESEVGALSNMGVCLEGLGKWQQAVEVYDRVIQLFEEKRATRDAFLFAQSHRDWIISTRL